VKERKFEPYRILIVDDAPSVREAMRWALEDEPDLVVVGEAGDGRAAVDQAIFLAADAVLLDIDLPGLNGYAVTRSLKALPDPPVVILLTIYADDASRQHGSAAGSDGFIEKSAGWPALIAQLRHLLMGRTPRRSSAS
jgi:DNA-binding NarL/FixJ family response regulator